MYPGAHAATTPDAAASIWAPTGAVMTYAELHDGARRLAQVLRRAGVRPGDHVAFCLENHPRYFEIAWGCVYAGAVYTAISSRLTDSELEYILNDCGAVALITSSYKGEQATAIVAQTPDITLRLMLDGAVGGYDAYEDVVDGVEPVDEPGRVAGVDMLYSSGTTGRPKGVALAFAPTPLEEARSGVTTLHEMLFGFDSSGVYLSPAPSYHAAPLRFVLASQALGGTAVLMDRFDPEDFLATIERYRVTHTQVVPTMFVRLLKLDPVVRTGYDVSSLRAVVHAAAPCPVPVKQSVIDWLGPIVHEYYAGTEGNGFVYCNSEQWLAHPGTVGLPILSTVHICDDLGNEVPVGERGTVYFESADPFEYHNDPEKTAASRLPNGWSTLGDVGYLDGEGYLYLTDRKAYMIISGGVNIYPQEAENVIINHPKVVDVAVFGIPNDEYGEEVKAIVEPVEMPTDDETAAALAAEIVAYCREHLADLKCPRSIDFRPELPRHPTGKLYKRQLRDEFWAD